MFISTLFLISILFAIGLIFTGIEFFLNIRLSITVDKAIFYRNVAKLHNIDQSYLTDLYSINHRLFIKQYILPRAKYENFKKCKGSECILSNVYILNYLNKESYSEMESELTEILSKSINSYFIEKLFDHCKEKNIQIDKRKMILTLLKSEIPKCNTYEFLNDLDDKSPEIEKMKLLL